MEIAEDDPRIVEMARRLSAGCHFIRIRGVVGQFIQGWPPRDHNRLANSLLLHVETTSNGHAAGDLATAVTHWFRQQEG